MTGMTFHRDRDAYEIRVEGKIVGTIWDTGRRGHEFRWKYRFDKGCPEAYGEATYRAARRMAMHSFRQGVNS